jgi:DNA-binding transcriptional LysR family regulator
MELEVRHLRVVCTVMRVGNVTQAAAQLGMTQPSLTKQLQRVERMLGGPLFLRTRNGLVPTALGEFVAARAASLLPMIDDIQHKAVNHIGLTSGARVLRYIATPGPLMVGLLDGLKSIFPNADVLLRTETDIQTILELIESGQQDLAAVVAAAKLNGSIFEAVANEVVATEPAMLLLSTKDPLATRSVVELAELRDRDWMLPVSRGSGLLDSFTTACHQAGFTARVRHEGEASALREVVASGLAVGLGQATFRATAGIAIIPLSGNPLLVRHLLLWQRSGALAAYIPRLIPHARATYSAAIDRSPIYRKWIAENAARDNEIDPLT